MYNIDPKLMCSDCLIQEHDWLHIVAESHKSVELLAGVLEGLLDVSQIAQRHNALENEMQARNPVRIIAEKAINNTTKGPTKPITQEESIRELRKRCGACRTRISNLWGKDGEG
jgi:hypothetical protein